MYGNQCYKITEKGKVKIAAEDVIKFKNPVTDTDGNNLIFGGIKKIEDTPAKKDMFESTKNKIDNIARALTGKSKTQRQLENLEVDVKVRESGIKIDGTFPAGDKIDKIGNNKGHNFPTFDIVIDENGKKTAISTKSLDLTSKSYTSKEYKNQMYYNIKGYIDDMDNFKKAGKGEDVLTKEMISKNVLEISINGHKLTEQQIDNIKRSIDYAKEKKVELKFIIEK